MPGWITTGCRKACTRLWGAASPREARRTKIAPISCRLQVDSDVLRSKLYSILLPAYTLLGERKEREKLIGTIRHLLPLVQAEQARANLLVTLYGCADSSLDYERAHEIVERWKKEESPKKSKARLIRWLDDYDRWLGH